MFDNEIHNLPEYASAYEYIVARVVDGELWFYGAWHDKAKAKEVAIEVNGLVISR